MNDQYKGNSDLSSSKASRHAIDNGTVSHGSASIPQDNSSYGDIDNRGHEPPHENEPYVNVSGPSFFKVLLFIVLAVAIVLIRRMDQMSYRHISEEEALELAQEVKVSIADQEIQLLDSLDSQEKQALKTGTTVKVLGVYMQKLNKGNSPRVYWTNQHYLIELPDGRRGFGPLMETAIGERTVLAEGDTAVITAVKKLKNAPTVVATGRTSQFNYAYTLEGHKEQYALEDLHIYFPQRLAYLGEGLTEESFTAGSDTLNGSQKIIAKVKKFFLYDIRPITKKNGFFLFPKYQTWNEFYLKRWFRMILIGLAYLVEIILIYKLWSFLSNRRTIRRARHGNAKACYYLASSLETGYGIVDYRDPDQAMLWYEKSASQGYGHACAHLGSIYERGRYHQYEPDIDFDLALKYYTLGAAKGNKRCKEGMERMKKLMSCEVYTEYRLAKEGNRFDQCLMGIYFYDGYYKDGVVIFKNEYIAMNWFQKSADQGYSDAINALGLCYEEGKGCTKDEKKAVSLFQTAIALGDARALFNLGRCYLYGIGVSANRAEAIRLFKQAARAGNQKSIDALNMLGERY